MSEEFERRNPDKDENSQEPVLDDKSESEGNNKPVIINAEAYKKIILYASRYANQSLPPDDWKEIYGILTGYSDDDFVYVKNAYPLTFGHETDVQLDERHYVFISEIEDKLYGEGKGHFMVGWFHSHPGLSLFFSDIDITNQLWFQQNNPDFCGLVFDHTLLGKKREEKIENNILTKYDTGFEIYRLTDVTIEQDSVEYENNYHKIDYIVEGLNKFFFANVLAELASLASAGKPLQEAFKEQPKLESNYQDIDDILDNSNIEISQENLVDIPLSEDIKFNVDDIFYETIIDNDKIKEAAEKNIYEGNQAFKNKDTFNGIEKYRQGIEKYKEINDMSRVMDLLRKVSRSCIVNNHLVIAREFADELYKIAEFNNQIFYKGIANIIIGNIIVREGDIDTLEYGLKKIEEAAVEFIKVKDFAGAGMAFNKIGFNYEKKIKNIGTACLFYREAIENYNNGLIHSHSLRITPWSKPEVLIEKISELRETIDVLLPDIETSEIKKKVVHDLKTIHYNF
jgi:proteasome lid subunit RPN8/RPN11